MITHGLQIVAVIVGSVAAAVAAAIVAGGILWLRATSRALKELRVSPSDADALIPLEAAHSRDDLDGLPAVVKRYFEFALDTGQPLIRHARMIQAGSFAASRDRWAPFTATEDFEVWPPGFVWDARIRLAPLVIVRVRDSYRRRRGAMLGRAAGLVNVVHQQGTPEMAASTLLRYLAEAPWFPTALLPSAGVSWEAIDNESARATLADGNVRVSMDVHFGLRGEITHITALRHRDVDGTPVLTPWEGRFYSYNRTAGMMVPGRSEVGWHLPDGWFPYWRGENVATEFEHLHATPDLRAESALERYIDMHALASSGAY